MSRARFEEGLARLYQNRAIFISRDYDHIKPQTAEIKVHVANDGTETEMACFTLQLPVTPFEHPGYTLPLEIWFPRLFPDRAPIIFLEPSLAKYYMPEVDASGMVVHQSLVNWDPKKTSLPATLQELSRTFARFAPWYLQQANFGSPSSSSSSSSRVYPVLPPPSSSHSPSPSPSPSPSSSSFSGSSSAGISRASGTAAPPNSGRGGDGRGGQSAKEAVQTLLIERAQLLRTIFEAEHSEDLKIRETLQQDQEEIQAATTGLQTADEMMTFSLVSVGKALLQSAEIGKSTVPPLDERVLPSSDINRQLLETVASDHAHSDLLYQLEKALPKGLFTVDQWVRLCREVAREQFKQKALTQRICPPHSLYPPT